MSDALAVSRLGVILARAGSKRLPGKNVRPFAGRPLIAWVIQAALSSEVFDRVLVSTDCSAIAREARAWGAWVPFLRPPELATDQASSLDALVHAVRWVVDQQPTDTSLQLVGLLQPTSPFLTATHVREAVDLFDRQSCHSLSSMCPIHERPEWMFHRTPSGLATPVDPEGVTKSSRDLPPLYRENGALYLLLPELLLKHHRLYDFEHHGSYLMSAVDSIDIDDASDWEIASAVMSARCQGHL
ncbi:MAG TPA: acylneuraminate cytidylyltransferase family protein [Candidatus Ozemobacteraceae bacterium]|nr:acylneuraminate cytidylyltransferase family protein [Candidatus Ozemobacteraceae bacterium]